MTKVEMKKYINAYNENKDIKWDIVKNTKSEILISNNYSTDILFKINFKAGEGNDIKITDENGWKENIDYLIHGSEFYCDFSDIEDGIKKAIGKVVKFFYYYY